MPSRTPSSTPLPFVLLSLAFTTLAPVASGADGTTCLEPQFEMAWDTDVARLTARSNADQAESFWVSLFYLSRVRDQSVSGQPELLSSPPSTCGGTKPADPPNGITFCLDASVSGSTALLRLHRARVLGDGGVMGLNYHSTNSGTCAARRSGPEHPELKVLNKNYLSFDVGSVFNLTGDGSWDTNAEAAASFRTHWFARVLAGVDIRYSAIQPMSSTSDAGDAEEDEQEEDAEEEEAPEEPFNPLGDGGGILEADLFAFFGLTPAGRFGPVVGGGFVTSPGEPGSKLNAETRLFAGFRADVEHYNADGPAESLTGSSGWVQAGMMWDDLYQSIELKPATDTTEAVFSDESERFFLEGQLEIPQVGNEWFRLAVRFFASLPTSGDGPSDVRISALATIDPRNWFGGVGKVPAAK